MYGTPNFRSWYAEDDGPAWPPRVGAGVRLIDTADREGRDWCRSSVDQRVDHRFDAALILARSAPRRSVLRRAVRWVRGRGAERVPAGRVAEVLRQAHAGHTTTRLGFPDDSRAPRTFEVGSPADSTGAAFLVTQRPPLSGSLWRTVHRRVGEPRLDIESLQLRTRGAAVILGRAGDRQIVIRVAPPGPHQHLVRANHVTLGELGAAFGPQSPFLGVVPQPLFEIIGDSAVILGETRLPGQLAWRVARGALSQPIYHDSLEFLDALRRNTRRATPWGTAEMVDLVQADLRSFLDSKVTTRRLRDEVGSVLRRAWTALAESEVAPYMSHGDYGYGNLLADPQSGALTGVIDWDTARRWDFPGVDRVNFEIQVRRIVLRERFPDAVEGVWRTRAAHAALAGYEDDQARALFGLAVCRYMHRSLEHEREFRQRGHAFEKALSWLNRSHPFDP